MNGEAPLTPDDLQILDQGLVHAAEALDRDIAASGATDRILARVTARNSRRPTRRAIWFAIAAALVIAAGLGSLADLAFIGGRTTSGQEVVVMDPLVFGPAVVDQR